MKFQLLIPLFKCETDENIFYERLRAISGLELNFLPYSVHCAPGSLPFNPNDVEPGERKGTQIQIALNSVEAESALKNICHFWHAELRPLH